MRTFVSKHCCTLPIATYLVVNEGSQGKVVEQVGKVFPDVCIAVLAQAFIVESVHLGNLARLVVATKDGDSIAKAHLEGDEQRHRLHRVVPSIDIVTHEQVVCVWRVTTDSKELRQIVLRVRQHAAQRL